MTFVITSGGTAGHVSPALAVAAELKRLDKQVIFAGSIGGMEERLARAAGLEYREFAAKGFDRQKPWTLVTSSLVLARSTRAARAWLKEINAEAVGAFGGYVSVPVGKAATREGIPLLVHEQNSHMGMTNKHLSKHADAIALTYAAAEEGLDAQARTRVHLTGNPVRPEFSALANEEHKAQLQSDFRQEMGFGAHDLVLLVFGGSQGARHINGAVVDLAPSLMKRPGLCVLQLTGRKEYARVESALAEKLKGTAACSKRWKLLDYCDHMPAAFAAADIVLARAGASSLAELAVAAKPALLVPFPYAAADHQRKNAESLVNAGAAHMVLDAELDTPRFAEVLFSMIDDTALRTRMLAAAKQVSDANAATEVAQLLIAIAAKEAEPSVPGKGD